MNGLLVGAAGHAAGEERVTGPFGHGVGGLAISCAGVRRAAAEGAAETDRSPDSSPDMFLARRPSTEEVAGFVAASRELPLSYDPAGLAAGEGRGFQVDEHTAILGHGEVVFERAKIALGQWRHFDLGWVEVFPKSPVAVGAVVGVLVRHLGFWSLNGCRVLYLVDSGGGLEFGYAYGSLTDHAQSGEEIFKVSYTPETGEVVYSIRAVSRPRARLARLGYPVARVIQARFRRDSASALARAVAG